ncbi:MULTISPECIES: YjaG family protein [unclassified Marinobacter]|uniref:YjaG family protein n=1 Tax=unclassified Marinobacter TaxID=83889 RepID=UPI0026E1E2CE|nr:MULTISPECIES: YjaG family protein [unclassified Marinobacter]MDO6444018.1 YjaG family protein [Marinobacter sp. 2_MG-2023]MDO6825661.1 YjaG family protein [Marinobacter sp. 1_MG-2023]
MNANQFLKAVSQLQGWRECAFLLALAERSFPNYALFAEAVGLKTGGKMHQILDLAWGTLQEDVTETAIPQLLAKLETLSPDVEAYDAYGVYPAFDFCQLLEQALLNRLNPSKHRATEASQLATATVMSFIELSEGEGLEEDELVRLLDSHPLMKEDKTFQRDLVLALKRQRTPLELFITELREDAANEGVSNLGISLGD